MRRGAGQGRARPRDGDSARPLDRVPGLRLVLAWSAFLLVVGCGTGDAPGGASGGVFDDFPDVPRYVFDSIPAVTIGRDPPSDDYVFQRVEAAGIIGDSLIVVFDGGLQRVGVYGFDGRFRRWVVTRGEGPGEARAITDGGVGPDGTIWFYDGNNNHRLTALDHHGNVTSASRLTGVEPLRMMFPDTRIVGPTPDGAWWFTTVGDVDPPRRPGQPYRVPREVRRIAPDGSVETVWSGQGEERVSGAGSGGLNPSFGTALYGSSVFLVWTDSAFIDRVDADGRRSRFGSFTARRRPAPRRTPSADAPPGVRASAEIPRNFHEIRGIFVGTDSTVWAALHEDAVPAYLSIADGRPAALLTGPPTGWPVAFGDGWVLLSRVLPDTGESVVELRRVRPRGGAGQPPDLP